MWINFVTKSNSVLISFIIWHLPCLSLLQMCLLIRLIRQAMCNDITLETSCILHAAMKEVLELCTFRTWWRIGVALSYFT